MAMNCYHCQSPAHLARDCPNAASLGADASGKPPWCGTCDERTRLVDLGEMMGRCVQCHPLRGACLPQHRRCSSCHRLVLAIDVLPCGKHQEIRIDYKILNTLAGW